MVYLHCALAAAQCIVIGPVCLFMAEWVAGCVIVGGSVTTNHDNSKLRASILTKLGLYVKVVTICSWLNFGHPMPPGRGSVAGRYFWLCLTTASTQCLHLSECFFHFACWVLWNWWLGSRKGIWPLKIFEHWYASGWWTGGLTGVRRKWFTHISKFQLSPSFFKSNNIYEIISKHEYVMQGLDVTLYLNSVEDFLHQRTHILWKWSRQPNPWINRSLLMVMTKWLPS